MERGTGEVLKRWKVAMTVGVFSFLIRRLSLCLCELGLILLSSRRLLAIFRASYHRSKRYLTPKCVPLTYKDIVWDIRFNQTAPARTNQVPHA
jgi:hypothetical protein